MSNESLFKKITLKKGEQILHKFDLERSREKLGVSCIYCSIIGFLCSILISLASMVIGSVFTPDTSENTILNLVFTFILPLLYLVVLLLLIVVFIIILRDLFHRISDYMNAPESLIKYYKYLVFTNKGIYSNLDNKDRYILWDEIEWYEISDNDDDGPYFAIKLKEKKDFVYLNLCKPFSNLTHHYKTRDLRHAADDAYSTYKKSLNEQQDYTNINTDALGRHSIIASN